MIKRILLILGLVIATSQTLGAQGGRQPSTVYQLGPYVQHSVIRSQNANTTGVTFLINPGNTIHQVTFSPASTVSGVTFDIQTAGGDGNFTSRGTSAIPAGGSISFTGIWRQGKIVITNYAGSGFIDIDYYGTAGVASMGADPCTSSQKTVLPFSIASATTTQLVAASVPNKLYVCQVILFASAANNVALVEDNDASCASPTAGMSGGATAATGWVFAAAGSFNYGTGAGTVTQTAAANRYVCFITSTNAQTSGAFVYVLAP